MLIAAIYSLYSTEVDDSPGAMATDGHVEYVAPPLEILLLKSADPRVCVKPVEYEKDVPRCAPVCGRKGSVEVYPQAVCGLNECQW